MAQKLHTFKAPSLDEAYQQMRAALGGEAVVLNTANVTDGGFLGLFGRKMVEVTASAPEPSPLPAKRARSSAERKYSEAARLGSDQNVHDTVAYFRQLVADTQKRMASQPPKKQADSAPGPVLPFAARGNRQKREAVPQSELREIRQMLEVLIAEKPGAGIPAEFGPHYRALVDRGVTRPAAAALFARMARGDMSLLRNPRVLRQRLKLEICKDLPVSGGIGLTPGRCRVVALVGATGVGKTTNLAKLAAHFAVRQRARVAMVTADTYRIAAPEQLRIYANIIGLPMHVVHEADEMAPLLRSLRHNDLVLVDTAGGSQFNKHQLTELQGLLAEARPDETMLVVSANTHYDDAVQVVTRFRVLKPTSLFMTKLDETQRFGPLFSLALETGLPLSYLSVGQNVPDDLLLAKPGMIADLIVKDGKSRDGSSSKSSRIGA
jgi:flagellar biosynthesis protein FlhF